MHTAEAGCAIVQVAINSMPSACAQFIRNQLLENAKGLLGPAVALAPTVFSSEPNLTLPGDRFLSAPLAGSAPASPPCLLLLAKMLAVAAACACVPCRCTAKDQAAASALPPRQRLRALTLALLVPPLPLEPLLVPLPVVPLVPLVPLLVPLVPALMLSPLRCRRGHAQLQMER